MPDTPAEKGSARYGERVAWTPERPRLGIARFLLGWVVGAAAVASTTRRAASRNGR